MATQEAQWLLDLYKNCFPQVAYMVQRQGGDLPAAKDLFHDALVIYLEKRNNPALHIRVSEKAYLMGIVRILWLRKRRAGSRELFTGELNEEWLAEDAAVAVDQEKENRSLLQQLQLAGEKCLQLLEAFYYRQWSMQKIAKELQYKTPHSATVQKYKCLEKLREQFKSTALYEEAFT